MDKLGAPGAQKKKSHSNLEGKHREGGSRDVSFEENKKTLSKHAGIM